MGLPIADWPVAKEANRQSATGNRQTRKETAKPQTREDAEMGTTAVTLSSHSSQKREPLATDNHWRLPIDDCN